MCSILQGNKIVCFFYKTINHALTGLELRGKVTKNQFGPTSQETAGKNKELMQNTKSSWDHSSGKVEIIQMNIFSCSFLFFLITGFFYILVSGT
jgi:hypothetical protein